MGAVRLDQVKSEFGDAVDIEWKAFLLRPEPEPRPMDKFTRYTQSWARPGSLEPAATFNEWSGEHEPPSHSLPSAIAGKVAATFGPELFEKFHWRLLESYFTENRTVSDIDVLVGIAGEAGIDATEFRTTMGDGAQGFAAAVIDDHNAAVNSGINGVPAVVVNGEFPFTGAQETDFYRNIVSNLSKPE